MLLDELLSLRPFIVRDRRSSQDRTRFLRFHIKNLAHILQVFDRTCRSISNPEFEIRRVPTLRKILIALKSSHLSDSFLQMTSSEIFRRRPVVSSDLLRSRNILSFRRNSMNSRRIFLLHFLFRLLNRRSILRSIIHGDAETFPGFTDQGFLLLDRCLFLFFIVFMKVGSSTPFELASEFILAEAERLTFLEHHSEHSTVADLTDQFGVELFCLHLLAESIHIAFGKAIELIDFGEKIIVSETIFLGVHLTSIGELREVSFHEDSHMRIVFFAAEKSKRLDQLLVELAIELGKEQSHPVIFGFVLKSLDLRDVRQSVVFVHEQHRFVILSQCLDSKPTAGRIFLHGQLKDILRDDHSGLLQNDCRKVVRFEHSKSPVIALISEHCEWQPSSDAYQFHEYDPLRSILRHGSYPCAT